LGLSLANHWQKVANSSKNTLILLGLEEVQKVGFLLLSTTSRRIFLFNYPFLLYHVSEVKNINSLPKYQNFAIWQSGNLAKIKFDLLTYCFSMNYEHFIGK